MKKFPNLFSTIFFSFIFFSSASAQEPAKIEAVKNFIEKIGNEIVLIANEKKLTEAKKRDKIVGIINISVDSEWISKFVLGKNYKIINDDQHVKFTKLYHDFMVNTYAPKFKNYNGRKFTVNEVTKQGGFYVAKAEFLPRDSDIAIKIDFRVKQRDEKFFIVDFIAEGVSLIETHRSEFNSAISINGFDKFLEELEQRVKKLKATVN